MSHLDLDWEIPQRALFFDRFSKFCRLIRFDKRGTGLSDRPVKMATLEERTAIWSKRGSPRRESKSGFSFSSP
jgi:hypothetical protein